MPNAMALNFGIYQKDTTMKNNFIQILLLMLAPFAGQAQSAKVFSEDNVNWKSYQTFSVSTGELVTVVKKEVDKEKILEGIRQTISSELTSRGLAEKPEGGDLAIDFTAELVETTNVEEIGPLGQAPADQPVEMDQSRSWTQERRQGSLAMDFSDSKTGKTIWRSSVTIDFGSDELAIVFGSAIGRSLRKFPIKK
jgi:hypothetical protein